MSRLRRAWYVAVPCLLVPVGFIAPHGTYLVYLAGFMVGATVMAAAWAIDVVDR